MGVIRETTGRYGYQQGYASQVEECKAILRKEFVNHLNERRLMSKADLVKDAIIETFGFVYPADTADLCKKVDEIMR